MTTSKPTYLSDHSFVGFLDTDGGIALNLEDKTKGGKKPNVNPLGVNLRFQITQSRRNSPMLHAVKLKFGGKVNYSKRFD